MPRSVIPVPADSVALRKGANVGVKPSCVNLLCKNLFVGEN